jgi:hypothetical protein
LRETADKRTEAAMPSERIYPSPKGNIELRETNRVKISQKRNHLYLYILLVSRSTEN